MQMRGGGGKAHRVGMQTNERKRKGIGNVDQGLPAGEGWRTKKKK